MLCAKQNYKKSFTYILHTTQRILTIDTQIHNYYAKSIDNYQFSVVLRNNLLIL